MRVPDAHFVVGRKHTLFFDAGEGKGGNVFQPLRLCADIFHVRPAAYSLNAVIKLHVRNRFNAADLIFHVDFQFAAELVVLVRKIDELHAVAGACGNVFVAVALARSVLPGNHNFQEIVSLGVQAQAARLAVVHVQQTALVKGERREVQQLAAEIFRLFKNEMQPVFVNLNQIHSISLSADKSAVIYAELSVQIVAQSERLFKGDYRSRLCSARMPSVEYCKACESRAEAFCRCLHTVPRVR